ncbi:glycosyltransferase, partial [Francisella tularensis subsp. holarctica]|nr:glycosyltransferase [Francisella tularensis subsp. holarctica]
FSFSSVPLILLSVLGLVVSIFALAYGFYIFVQSLFVNVNVTGWPTIVVSSLFFSGVQLISVGVLGEYKSRIFDEAQKRP